LQNMRAQAINEKPWTPQHLAILPEAVRLKADGAGPTGQAVKAHAVWFAHIDGDAVRLVHAVVYQNKTSRAQNYQSADQFLESLKLP